MTAVLVLRCFGHASATGLFAFCTDSCWVFGYARWVHLLCLEMDWLHALMVMKIHFHLLWDMSVTGQGSIFSLEVLGVQADSCFSLVFVWLLVVWVVRVIGFWTGLRLGTCRGGPVCPP